jgi:very-short-patch-repair endonuclease
MTKQLGTRAYARTLRKSMPAAEVVLWSHLRRKAVLGLGFRRQFPIGPYFADFACPAIRLVIEVDGSTHWTEAAQARDVQRRLFLVSQGWHEIRVSNEEVFRDLDRVLEYVIATAAELRKK